MEQTPIGSAGYGNESTTVSVGDWMITLLISAIPVIGFIMLFVWAFSGGTPPSKANWAKAALIFLAILVAIYLVIFMLFGAAIISSMEGLS